VTEEFCFDCMEWERRLRKAAIDAAEVRKRQEELIKGVLTRLGKYRLFVSSLRGRHTLSPEDQREIAELLNLKEEGVG